jgi:hypothetical protein
VRTENVSARAWQPLCKLIQVWRIQPRIKAGRKSHKVVFPAIHEICNANNANHFVWKQPRP